MRVSVILTTFNRRDLFRDTVLSLKQAAGDYTITVMDAGCTDGTEETIQSYLALDVINEVLPVTTPGIFYPGTVEGIDYALKVHKPDILLLTADDYNYASDWYKVLTEFLSAAPPTLSHVTLDIEPDWSWNTVEGTLDAGGHRALIRRTAPGANWAMTVDSWKRMESGYRFLSGNGQLDHILCGAVRSHGLSIAALDLAEHIGAFKSSCGNQSYQNAKPIDRARWGLPAHQLVK